MNIQNHGLFRHWWRTGLFLTSLFGAMLLAPMVQADTAANAIIQNTATLSFDDGGGIRTTNASVDVTVSLVESPPVLNAPTDIATDVGTPATYNYTITSTANGPDTYDLSLDVLSESAGINSSTVSINGAAATSTTGDQNTIDLGATTVFTGVTLNAASNTVITVPSDDNNGDAAVNGIAVGETVEIGGFLYNVVAIDDSNGGSPGQSTITVDFDGNTPALAVGDVVGEQRAFTVVVTPGTVTVPAVTQTIDITIGAQDDTDATAATQHATQTSVTSGAATLTKYVRNVTTAGGNAGGAGTTSLTVNTVANNYFTSGVTGQTGDTLEYVLVAENTGGVDLTANAIADTLPVAAYVVFVANAYGAGNDISYTNEAAAESFLTEAADGDAGVRVGTALDVNVGTGATNAAGGTIAAGDSVQVAFQVVIQ